MTTSTATPTYLAGTTVSPEQLQAWVEQFHQQGFLFLQNVLPLAWCAELRANLDWALEHNPNGFNSVGAKISLAHRLFETSPANLRLFDLEPIVSLAEALIAPNCHVIHNNSFQSPHGGGIAGRHQDDDPQCLPAVGAHRGRPTNSRNDAVRPLVCGSFASLRSRVRHACSILSSE